MSLFKGAEARAGLVQGEGFARATVQRKARRQLARLPAPWVIPWGPAGQPGKGTGNEDIGER